MGKYQFWPDDDGREQQEGIGLLLKSRWHVTGEMAQQLSPCHLPSEQEDKSSDLQNPHMLYGYGKEPVTPASEGRAVQSWLVRRAILLNSVLDWNTLASINKVEEQSRKRPSINLGSPHACAHGCTHIHATHTTYAIHAHENKKRKLIDKMSFPKGPVSEIHIPEHRFHPYEYGNGAVSATPMPHFWRNYLKKNAELCEFSFYFKS